MSRRFSRRRLKTGFEEQFTSFQPLEQRFLLSATIDPPDNQEPGHGSGCMCPSCAATEHRHCGHDHSDVITDEFGTIFFDPAPILPPAEDPLEFESAKALAEAAPFPLDQTFFLHSNPGASKTVYLDFDGHTTSGTAWNSGIGNFTTPKYNFQGSSDTFTNAELERIQYIWERVAEDFMPFDVNITTEDPGTNALRRSGSGDQNWGVRVVIGGSSYDWFGRGAGGVAYVGSFNWSSDTPTYVFTEQLGNGNEKYTAEAASHEIGHTLGLYHDGAPGTGYYTGHGSGATGWAPIMGVAYYESLSQWSKGEYSGANNTQNDLNVITTQNGFGYRSDDHGDSRNSATTLTQNGTSISSEGLIERTNDVDYFRFATGGGNVSISINPFHRSPNLDIVATLYDSNGSFITSNNPSSSLSANFNLFLSEGTYYISIDGTGKGDPLGTGYTDYGSIGYYSISGSAPPSQSGLSLYFEDFQDGTADGFSSVAGSFLINSGGKYVADGTGDDPALAVLDIGQPLPTQFTFDATMKVGGDTGDLWQNSLIVFDYQSINNFKYVQMAVGSGQWRLGHQTNGTWNHQDTWSPSLAVATDYNVELVIDKNNATVFIDGVQRLSKDYAYSVFDGAVGVGNRNSISRFDNLTITDDTSVITEDNFNDGAAQGFSAVAGSWQVLSGAYEGTSDAGATAISLASADGLGSSFVIQSVLSVLGGANLWSNALIIFDYQNANNFKFVQLAVGAEKWRIGHFDGTWHFDAETGSQSAQLGQPQSVSLSINNNAVSLMVNGQNILQTTYADSLHDGQIGFGARNSKARFDDWKVV